MPITNRGTDSDRAPTSLGTLGIFCWYGVGNPPDFVSEQVPSLVNTQFTSAIAQDGGRSPGTLSISE